MTILIVLLYHSYYIFSIKNIYYLHFQILYYNLSGAAALPNNWTLRRRRSVKHFESPAPPLCQTLRLSGAAALTNTLTLRRCRRFANTLTLQRRRSAKRFNSPAPPPFRQTLRLSGAAALPNASTLWRRSAKRFDSLAPPLWQTLRFSGAAAALQYSSTLRRRCCSAERFESPTKRENHLKITLTSVEFIT